MTDKIKILFLASNPVNVKYRLELEKEFKAIAKKLRVGRQRDSFELLAEWNVEPGELQEILQWHKPHILHFSGHGSRTEGIALEDENRNLFLLDKQALTNLLRVLKDNLRMVILNACYSKDQANDLRDIVDFTVGMKKAIGDQAAIVFASHFYQSLAFGRSVQEAFELGKGQLDIFKIPESKTPKLLVRLGVDPTQTVLPQEGIPRDDHRISDAPQGKSPSTTPPQNGVSFNNKDCDIGSQHAGPETHIHEYQRGQRRRRPPYR